MKTILSTARACCLIGLSWPATAFTQAPADSVDESTAAIRHKLEAIVVPQLELHEAALPDAVEQLREQGRQLDSDPDPNTRGINIFVKMTASSGAPPRVTLNITRAPILEALGKIAAQVGMKVKIEPYAVSLVPLSEQSDPMMTTSFHLPPEAIGLPTDAGWESRRDVKDFLESKGVTFPPGASAVYLPTVQKLVVRNTSRNVEVMKTLFAPVAAPTASVAPKSP